MNQFGDLYSEYYDLLYNDKDYVGEVEYIDNLIKSNNKNASTILDMGCGTGKHAEMFCDIGYTVHGIDLSEDMLKIAENRRKFKKDKLSFSHSNIQDLNIGKKFDVVVSLFHVMSYQNKNDELIRAFEVAKNHLNKDGIFIFDFWYGPAVLTDLPVVKTKKLENKNLKITRISEPTMFAQENTVDVNYDIFIQNKLNTSIIHKQELHKMRYFFDTELELICERIGFKILNKNEWMNNKNPDFESWNVVWVVK